VGEAGLEPAASALSGQCSNRLSYPPLPCLDMMMLMFGIAAVVFFAIALILEVFDLAKGHVNYVTFGLAGLLCLAIHVVAGWWPAKRG
jgi:hypothetical protein